MLWLGGPAESSVNINIDVNISININMVVNMNIMQEEKKAIYLPHFLPTFIWSEGLGD